MQALVLDGQELKLDAHYPAPKAKPGEVIIRPTLMGVCSTDLELCRGYMGFAGVLGHEFVGVVTEAGDAAGKAWVGKRVVGTINCVCGVCDLCKMGLREHCRVLTVLGIQGRDGCLAEAFSLPAENLLEVPEEVDDEAAVFTEPLAAAFQIPRQIPIEGRPYITVLGDGRLGLLCAQVLSRLNATVRCVGKHPEKMRLCEKWGIPARPLDEVGLRQDQDIVVDATGSASGLATALQMVRPRGTVVLKTTVAPPMAESSPLAGLSSADLAPIVIHEINLVGSRCGPFPEALRALQHGEVDVTSMISRRARLEDGPELLRLAKTPGVIKVLVRP